MAEAAILSADEEPLQVRSDRSSHQHYIVNKKTQNKSVLALWCSLLTSFGNPSTGQSFPHEWIYWSSTSETIHMSQRLNYTDIRQRIRWEISFRRASVAQQKHMSKMFSRYPKGNEVAPATMKGWTSLTCLLHSLSYGPISYDRQVWASCTSRTVSGRVSDLFSSLQR